MENDDKIRDEKLKFDVNREAEKTSTLSYRKMDNYGYLTDEEILPSNQRQTIDQAKFIYSLLRKAFEKQTKPIEEQQRKQ